MEQKYCKECCREITEEEAKKYGHLCKKCYSIEEDNSNDEQEDNEQEYNEQGYKRYNGTATLIKTIAFIGAIIGVFFGIAQFDSAATSALGIACIAISIISGIFIYALGEIIQLLEDIKNK